MMPRSFLVKKKPGTCAAWQWKEPEQLEWKQEDTVGKIILLFLFFFVTGIRCNVVIYVTVCAFLLNPNICLLPSRESK